MPRAYAFRTDRAGLSAILQRLGTQLVYAIVDDPGAIRFQRIQHGENGSLIVAGRDAAEWRNGRAFGPTAEIRWRELRRGLRALVVTDEALDWAPGAGGEAPWPAPDAYALQPDREAAAATPLAALWGERQDPRADPDVPDGGPYWYEQQIPDFHPYPWTGPEPPPARVAVELNAYRIREPGKDDYETDPADRIYRFAGLAEFPPPPAGGRADDA